MALDTYFRGNATELEFCEKIRAGGNHLVATTASGKRLAAKSALKFRQRELAPVLKEFAQLPEADRKPKISTIRDDGLPERELPLPPKDGLIIRGYCTYMHDRGLKPDRMKRYYYERNPDRWQAEPQSDMLWLTEHERQSLIPDSPKSGATKVVDLPIQRRFFSTIGIDYMEGSVDSLPVRESRMTVTVETIDERGLQLRLDGYGQMGREFTDSDAKKAKSRGCELRILGRLHCDKNANFDQFDVVGLGSAWGHKRNNTRRIIGIRESVWLYGIACEIVTPQSPIDRIPPYNLLHYNGSGEAYFTE